MTSSGKVNIYGYAMHQAVNVWDFVEWLCTRKMRGICRKSLRIP